MRLAKYWMVLAMAMAGVGGCSRYALRTPEPAPEPTDATAATVYHVLAAELASHRGRLDEAFEHYVWLARSTRDVGAAAKAARIGLHLNKNGDTLEASALWASLEPGNTGAQQAKAIVFLREGREQEAYEALIALVELLEQEGRNGYAGASDVIKQAEAGQAGVAMMRRLVAREPKNGDAHYALALVLVAHKDLAGAVDSAKRSTRLNPRNELAWLLLSRLYAMQDEGEGEASGAALHSGLDHNPESQVLRLAYAAWLVEAGRLEAAYREFQRLEKKSPDNPDVMFSLGALATDLERWDAARRYWRRLIDSGKKVDQARYYLALVEESTGNPRKALALYAEVADGGLKLDAAVRSANILARQGDISGTRELIAQQRVLYPDHAVDLYLIEGELLSDAGRHAESMAVYDTALKAFPRDEQLLYARAMQGMRVDRLDILERDLRQLLVVNPDHADALNALGYTLADLTDRYAEALNLISRAFALKPDNPAILDSMGWVHYRLGKHDQALDFLQRAAARVQDSEIAAHLGEVLWVIGREDDALRVWREALTHDPNNPNLRGVMERFRSTTP